MLKRLSRPTGRKLALLFCCGTVLLASGPRAHAQGRNKTDDLLALIEAQAEMIAVLDARVVELEAKLDAVSVDELGDIYVDGVNVHIRNRTGDSQTTNAAGNLIIGYNEGGGGSGSHNLVVGIHHEFYSYGGIVAGFDNEISAPYASVTGGASNVATGRCAMVSGGLTNLASGDCSSVSGGIDNDARGGVSSVSGGVENIAAGVGSSVSGGMSNLAARYVSSVTGGREGQALGEGATVLGGIANNASVDFSIVPTTLGDP